MPAEDLIEMPAVAAEAPLRTLAVAPEVLLQRLADREIVAGSLPEEQPVAAAIAKRLIKSAAGSLAELRWHQPYHP